MQTYSKQQARDEIGKLVATFAKNEAALQNKKEAQIEQNYIRPLFRFLNWNTENEGLAPANWEFILQDTDRKGKMPDYRLELDGQHLLLMDAKMVKYDMHDPRWQYQVYGYAYCTQNQPFSRKVDFAVLTDFQEFILLDCTLYAVKPEVVNNFRILDWTCDDYVNQFDTLWELFERENMRAAARTRGTKKPTGLWAQYLSPQKAKANRIPPDKAFLANMDDDKVGWRILLAKDMKKHNPKADSELITAAVQLLIDRLLFIKALSDREIEDDFLADLAEQVEKAGLADQDKGWFTACESIFAKLNRTYNGSIFEPRPELEAVAVSNKVIRDIIRDLQPENSPYNFASMPVEILGTIYERFLGRVVNATDQRVKIEDKPEVRKAGGVYYTPQYIVEYIVQNTVGKLLSDCKNPADVAKLKILDPACGSGSFLIGAYEALILWHEKYYGGKTQIAKRDREAAYYDSDGRVRLTAKLKRQILLNNVFGVDIDQQAVEVTRFSLSLKALEDTKRNELYEEVSLFKKTVLPDLRSNIKCGNSLIASDFSMVPEDLVRVRAFDWPVQFPAAMKVGGFDAVIGNPPYIDSEWMSRCLPTEREYCANTYVAASGNWDLFCVFIDRSIQLARQGGLVSLIVPNKLGSAGYASGARKLLTNNSSLLSIRDFSHVRVFPVSVYPLVFVSQNTKSVPETVHYERMRASEGQLPFVELDERLNYREYFSNTDQPWQIFASISKNNLPSKLSSKFPKLETSATVLGAATVSEAYEIAKLIKGRGRGLKLANSGTIDRFHFLWGEKECRYLGASYLNPVISPADQIRLPKKRLEQSRSPKIVIAGMTLRLECAVDLQGEFVAGKSTTIVFPKSDLRYVLAILNSRVVQYFYSSVFGGNKLQGGYLRIGPPQLSQIPIPPSDLSKPADKARHDKLVGLVEKILSLTSKLRVAKGERERETLQNAVTATDRQIDRLVYELYGLTEEEIKIVESEC